MLLEHPEQSEFPTCIEADAHRVALIAGATGLLSQTCSSHQAVSKEWLYK
jgi:hypothetical protein